MWRLLLLLMLVKVNCCVLQLAFRVEREGDSEGVDKSYTCALVKHFTA